ncbi:CHAT domain-containing protein, partial [Miniimonas arenae]|uniref:CHAT domain-containing protein n=1 Tax=Miniimonas arenae TaxID=676201 RepID=UPI0028A8D355
VVLVRSRRLDRAREVIAERATAGSLPLPVVATLAAAAGDLQRAAAALQAMDAAGASGTPGTGVPLTWQDALPRAEVELALGRVAQAWDTARAGVAQLEAFVAELVRDPDRLDACDQPDVAALYGVLARAALAVGGPQAPSLALMSVERLRLLSAGVGVEGDGDGRAPGGGSDADPTLHRWRRAAADYSVAAGRVLARVAGAGVADDAFADLDAADAALAGAERDLDARRPGILLRRAAPRQPEDPDAIRARMPPDAVLLEYLTTSDEVLGWAVTREGVRTATVPCPRRELAELTRRLHASCAAGHADPAALAQVSELVLGPWRAELDTHERVVVVPFGSLAVVPFHVLRTGGVPLAATHVVSYALRATDAFGPDGEAPVRARRPLVVGDPAFDP